MQIDINCDVGEGIGNEALLMPFISSANIACGYHAGDEDEMKKMVMLCLKYEVAIGAHPSFPGKGNFGRTEMSFSVEKIREIITAQLELFNKITLAGGGKLHHVKLHGALYNMASKDIILASCAAEAVKDFNSNLIYYGLSGSVMIREAIKSGLRTAQEVFADRSYQPDGSLTPRSKKNALITDSNLAVRQVIQMINEQMVTTAGRKNIPIHADTICIHGDGPQAVEFAKKIHDSLQLAGIKIQPVDEGSTSARLSG